jgi:hypothetical protein
MCRDSQESANNFLSNDVEWFNEVLSVYIQ